MITLTTSKPAVVDPSQLPTKDLHEALHISDHQLNTQYNVTKKKRKYKTIHELNPNPNLLSKKAIKTREMKMKYLNKDSNEDENLSAQASNIVETKLGGRQLQLLKSSSPVFSKDVHPNYIMSSNDESESKHSVRMLGSRQKNLASSHRSNSFVANNIQNSSHRKDKDLASRYQNAFSRSPTSPTLNKELHNNFRHSRKFPYSKEKKPVAFLGSRQLGLLRSQTINETTSIDKTTRPRRRKGRVRKVLTGRRKISSSELILKAASFFH